MIFLRRKKKKIIVAINVKPVNRPWGGGNQFIIQLKKYLERNGCKVTYKLKNNVNVILLIAPKPFQNVCFDTNEIYKFKKLFPNVSCIHRVNECDKRKGTDHIDSLLSNANEVADYTVFISKWLREYHTEKWFDISRPNSVVYNGADNDIFNSQNGHSFNGVGDIDIVTHHWSDNEMKGFDVYRQIDELIFTKKITGYRLNIVGRWPVDIVWKTAITHTPMRGQKLARYLKNCHLYVTASRWEPCGMHHVEGAQCGLPLLYHVDGGGIVEAGKKYGIGFKDDIFEALLEAKKSYKILRQQVLSNAPSGEKMCKEYLEVILNES